MDNNQSQQEIIERYITAYNRFDIHGMLNNLHDDVYFENVLNGEVNLRTHGIEAFKNQAESAKELFQTREQKIIEIQSDGDTVEVKIDYNGILAEDLPNGLKAGDTIKMSGKSTFIFKEGKIIQIRDES